MKPFKIFQIALIGLGITLVGITKVQAQQRMTPDQRVEMKVRRMSKELNLTDDQVARIKPMIADAQDKMMQLRNSGGDAQAIKQQRKDVAGELDKKITALLNPDQIQKYNTMKAQMRERRMQHNENQSGE